MDRFGQKDLLSEETFGNLVERFDTNKDGLLDQQETIEMTVNITNPENLKEYISVEKLSDYKNQLRRKSIEILLENVWDQYDTQNRGYFEKIECVGIFESLLDHFGQKETFEK